MGWFLFIALLLIYAAFKSRCPNCQRFFAIRRTLVETITPTRFLQTGKSRYIYRCKYCNHNWEKIEYDDVGPDMM